MKSLKLSDREKTILYLVLTNGAATVPRIAELSGEKPHVVQAALRKFHSHNLLARHVLVNPWKLGYSAHDILITLSSEGQAHREAVAHFLSESSSTTAVFEVGGECDFLVQALVTDATGLSQFYLDLSERFEGCFLKKDLATTIQHTFFGEKHLTKNRALHSEDTVSATSETVEIDEIDRRILFELSDPLFTFIPVVARKIGLPLSTVDYRIKRLRDRAVIAGDMNRLKGECLGFSRYMLLVSMAGISSVCHKAFYSFARDHNFIYSLTHSVGRWDYRLSVSAPKVADIQSLVHQLKKHFGDSVVTIKSLPMFHAKKIKDFPVKESAVLLRKAQ